MANTIRNLGEIAVNVARSFSKQDYFSKKNTENKILGSELRKDSVSKKEAIRQIIANMTVGLDVSELFSDVLQCMQTTDSELKRLVYLYLIYNSKQNEESAIMVINTFCKDSESDNPLLRALALRTAGSICVEAVFAHTIELIKKATKDRSPYVRKTAVLSIAKIFRYSSDICTEKEIVEFVYSLLNDTSSLVIRSVIAALREVDPRKKMLKEEHIEMIVSSFEDGTEWCQIEIMSFLSECKESMLDKEKIVKMSLPRLKHKNLSVVLLASKLICMNSNEHREVISRALSIGIGSPLPEIQFVFLCSIPIFFKKDVSIDISKFFCKYNEPIYVKKKKIEIIAEFCDEDDCFSVLKELHEYALDSSVDLVKCAAKCLKEIGNRLYNKTSDVFSLTMNLLLSNSLLTFECALVCLESLYRKNPFMFDERFSCSFYSLISEDNKFKKIKNVDAKTSFLWIIGETRTDFQKDAFISYFVSSLEDEDISVQRYLLIAIMKTYLSNEITIEIDAILQKYIEGDSIELKDTACFYKELLKTKSFCRDCLLSQKYYEEKEKTHIDLLLVGSVSSIIERPKYEKNPFLKKSNNTLIDIIDLEITEETQNAEKDDLFSILCG